MEELTIKIDMFIPSKKEDVAQTSSFAVTGTIHDFRDLHKSIEEMLDGYRDNKKPNIKEKKQK